MSGTPKNAKALITSALIGVLFGVGLVISGMTKPAKVIGFLDIAGQWDASLAFVMVGAIGVHLALYRFIIKRRSPLFDIEFHIPSKRTIDAKLVIGAVLFGLGWGLGGYCPGPAIVTGGALSFNALVFVAAMTIGMFAEQSVVPASATAAARRP